MKVSLTEACRLLGQSARQVRYRIRAGELVGRRASADWWTSSASALTAT